MFVEGRPDSMPDFVFLAGLKADTRNPLVLG